MPALVDLTGKRFGRLIVIKRVERPYNLKKKAAYWLCKCDCGSDTIVISNGLIDYGDGGSKTRSCGCLNKEINRKRIYDKVDGCPAQNRVLGYYKNSSKKRELPFELTKQEFLRLVDKSCFYCGCEPSRVGFNSVKTISFLYNGVDRIDNKKGYTVENCVPCCTHCNKAKLDMTIEEFKNWVRKVYKNFAKE